MMYRGNNRIQAYSAKNRPVFGLGSSFGEPQDWDDVPVFVRVGLAHDGVFQQIHLG